MYWTFIEHSDDQYDAGHRRAAFWWHLVASGQNKVLWQYYPLPWSLPWY